MISKYDLTLMYIEQDIESEGKKEIRSKKLNYNIFN